MITPLLVIVLSASPSARARPRGTFACPYRARANVLHDRDGRRSFEILHNCRQAMPGAGKVLIVERLIPDNGDDPLTTLLSDINVLMLTGGQARTNAEYASFSRRPA